MCSSLGAEVCPVYIGSSREGDCVETDDTGGYSLVVSASTLNTQET